LQLVDLAVGGHHAARGRDVAADQRIDRFHDLPFGEATHFRDQPGQFLQVAVESLGGMFKSHVRSPRNVALFGN